MIAALLHFAEDQYQAALWDSINAMRGHPWESNSRGWVVEFRRIEGEAG